MIEKMHTFVGSNDSNVGAKQIGNNVQGLYVDHGLGSCPSWRMHQYVCLPVIPFMDFCRITSFFKLYS